MKWQEVLKRWNFDCRTPDVEDWTEDALEKEIRYVEEDVCRALRVAFKEDLIVATTESGDELASNLAELVEFHHVLTEEMNRR